MTARKRWELAWRLARVLDSHDQETRRRLPEVLRQWSGDGTWPNDPEEVERARRCVTAAQDTLRDRKLHLMIRPRGVSLEFLRGKRARFCAHAGARQILRVREDEDFYSVWLVIPRGPDHDWRLAEAERELGSYYGGPGRPFQHGPYIRTTETATTVYGYGGLDI